MQSFARLGQELRFTPFQPIKGHKPGRRCCQVKAASTEAQNLKRRDLILESITLGAGLVAVFPGAVDAIAKPAKDTPCTDLTKAADGIEWCDTKQGEGDSPSKGDLIRCHYTGRLASGKVFDSSYGRRPLTFKVGNREVIQGWDKAILGDGDLPAMKEGGKRRVNIPPELAYGAKGAGGVIPPNATLTFDVELLGKR